MSAHTPGPWVFERDEDIPHYRLIRATHDNSILMGDPEFYPWCPTKDADWHLIAAAPALLDLIRRAETFCRDRRGGGLLAEEMRAALASVSHD